MRTHSIWPRVFVLGLTCVALIAAFTWIVRPWYQRWGATPSEQRMALPSDSILPNAISQETRAITIDASADRVWPWVAQLGQDRGGFYSFDVLENLVGCDMPTVDRLQPDKQQWMLGDTLWMYPKSKANGQGFATLRAYERGRTLGFAARAFGTAPTAPENGSWAFAVLPIDASHTRLLVRGRGDARGALLGVAFDRSVFEPMHFVMERRTMIGIKQLAEEGSRHRIANHGLVLSWVAAFALFVWAAIRVIGTLRDDRWPIALAGFIASAALFQLLTFVQPPVVVSWILVGLTYVLVRGRLIRFVR